jgi:Fe-S cluster assembly iron-binding protein IscA
VAALQALPAYVVTPLMNMQFVWMVVIGARFTIENPNASSSCGCGTSFSM